jgi:hypothetical protein
LCLPKILHVFSWNYPYITMWKHANFHMVFEYYWLYRVWSVMVDPKYLQSDVFGRYFVLIWKIFCAYRKLSMCCYSTIHTYPCGNMQISSWFLNITVCVVLEVE